MIRKSAWILTLMTAAFLAASSITALAGPPLICHRLGIGNAKSLSWGDDPSHWDQPAANYDISKLADDTLALLSPGARVIVRMETIRRAVLYARRSPEVSKELVLKLSDRARNADSGSKGSPLAWFDYGYLIETMKEANWAYHDPSGNSDGASVATKLDGYPWVTKALAASDNNPEMEFALALIVMGRRDLKTHREYAQAALAGARSDSLLARNLTGSFMGGGGETMTTLLTKAAHGSE